MASKLRACAPLRFHALAAAALLLVSCDSKPDMPPESGTGHELDSVSVGRLICGGHLPLAVVEKMFQCELQTFVLRTVQNHSWHDVVTDMKSGKLAGTLILSPLAMNLIREGFPGKIVFLADRNGNGFVLSKLIPSIAELGDEKRIIAVPHIYSQHHVLLHMALAQHKVPTDQIRVLAMPPRDMINSLRNGEIDGFVVGEPEGARSVSLGIGWLAATSPQIWKDHMDHVLLASDAFIEERPEDLQDLVDQLVRGARFIEENPREASIMGEDYTGSAAGIFEEVLTTPPDWITYTNAVVKEADMMAMAKQLVEMKLWPTVPEGLVDAYLDMRFAREAERKMRGH